MQRCRLRTRDFARDVLVAFEEDEEEEGRGGGRRKILRKKTSFRSHVCRSNGDDDGDASAARSSAPCCFLSQGARRARAATALFGNTLSDLVHGAQQSHDQNESSSRSHRCNCCPHLPPLPHTSSVPPAAPLCSSTPVCATAVCHFDTRTGSVCPHLVPKRHEGCLSRMAAAAAAKVTPIGPRQPPASALLPPQIFSRG